jgi:hypothetical protein
MDSKLQIDAIGRQTTVLSANLATAAGVRAPLAHVADQVFVELAKEIESQGVSRKVVADMFGLALRTYQKRVQRLTESVTESQQTLWAAVLDFVVQKEGSVAREEVIRRFRYDGERQVASVLNDLVSSGLLYRSGRGDNCVYGATSEQDYARYIQSSRQGPLSDVVVVTVYRNPGCTLADLCGILPFDEEEIRTALDEALAECRIEEDIAAEPPSYSASTVTVPVGSAKGWEAAVFDHYQAVCTAIAKKLAAGQAKSENADMVGGATLSFDIAPDHPFEHQVKSLLQRTRQDVNVLWMAVDAYDKANPIAEEDKTRVVFYFGQYMDEPEPEEDVAEQ